MEETPVKLLSYGDRRILEITLSLTPKPSLLLLDEPTSGLMSEDRKRISDFMKKISSRLTLVAVEHDMDVVMSISDHIVVLCPRGVFWPKGLQTKSGETRRFRRPIWEGSTVWREDA